MKTSRLIFYSSVGISIVCVSSCQLSRVKLPEPPSEKISPKTSVSVSLVFAFNDEVRFCLYVLTSPVFSVMKSWNKGAAEEGKTMTVALLICVPSVDKTNGKVTVLV